MISELAKYCSVRGVDDEQIDEMCAKILAVRKLCHIPEDFPEVAVEMIDDGDSDGEDQDPAEPPDGWRILSLGKRVVSVSRTGAVRTLHEVGKCYRRPGVDDRQYIVLDDGELGDFHKVCSQCFPKQNLGGEADSSSSESLSSSSGSSDSD